MSARGEEPTSRKLNEALRRFGELLEAGSSESDFQQLFTDCPYIFSRTLPLHFEASDVVPRGRPGKAEPDFLIYPNDRRLLGNYGIVELKRPDTKLFVRPPRVGTLELASDVRTAIAQSRAFEEKMLPGQSAYSNERVVMLGNRSEIFVIAGLWPELAAALSSEIYHAQLTEKLPSNCKLIPYDSLFKSFNATVPPRLLTLRPGPKFEADEYLFEGVRFRTIDPAKHPSLRNFSCGSSTRWEHEVNMIVAGLYDGDRRRQPIVRLAETDGDVVGVSASEGFESMKFTVAEELVPPSNYLDIIAVSEQYRGSRTPEWERYGDLILRDALSVRANDDSKPEMFSLVSPENLPAKWLADRNGFASISDPRRGTPGVEGDQLIYRPAGLPIDRLSRAGT